MNLKYIWGHLFKLRQKPIGDACLYDTYLSLDFCEGGQHDYSCPYEVILFNNVRFAKCREQIHANIGIRL